jgi:uncharacterized repeat protein (TIGR03803 family)
MIILVLPTQAQTFNVIHSFTGGFDGGNPFGSLTMDAAGNLYGTACGASCALSGESAGTVFKLSKRGSGWVFTTLYAFHGTADGAGPSGRVIIGPDGALYGTTVTGGINSTGCGWSDRFAGCGIVFQLTAPDQVQANVFGGWNETVLYSFRGGSDGAFPELVDLTFDAAGNMYGTTNQGGRDGRGTVFQLTPSATGWKETLIYDFGNGIYPLGGVVFDGAGNLYGTTLAGGGGGRCDYGSCGSVFELIPSESGWTEKTLYSFQGGSDGGNPVGGVMLVGGTVIVAASWGGAHGGGTALRVGNDLFSYSFTGNSNRWPYPGPWAKLVGNATNLYGTTLRDGAYEMGSVFNLSGCAGWGYTSLHDFTGGHDGAYPVSSVVFDADGNLFGTTSSGGAHGFGVVFEITPTLDSTREPARSSECARYR